MADARLPEEDWPPQFADWPRPSQLAYLMLRLERHEIIIAIGERADIESIQRRAHEMDPSTARLTKEELAELAIAMGVHLDTYPDRRGR